MTLKQIYTEMDDVIDLLNTSESQKDYLVSLFKEALRQEKEISYDEGFDEGKASLKDDLTDIVESIKTAADQLADEIM